MQRSRQEFAPEPTAVRKARRFVADTLAAWGATTYEWQVTQAVSELATNAFLHARTTFDVELTLEGSTLRLSVSDSSSRKAMPRRISDQATTGRGLGLLSTLSQDWGVAEGKSGKTIWCVFTSDGDGNGRGSSKLKQSNTSSGEYLSGVNPLSRGTSKALAS